MQPESAPTVALGTAQWGQPYGIANRTGVPRAAALRRMMGIAKRFGVSTLDTARGYAGAEDAIRAALDRDHSFRIVTKLAPDVLAAGAAEAAQCTIRSLRASEAALGVARLDTVLLHRAAHRMDAGGVVWLALRSEQREGRITKLGVSANSPEEAWAASEDDTVEVIQVAASVLDQRLLRSGFFATAAARGKEVFVRSVFLQGVVHLRDAELPRGLSPLLPVLHLLDQVGARVGLSRAEIALGFAAAQPNTRLVLGTETPEQLDALLGQLTKLALAEDAVAELAQRVPELDPRLLTPSRWPELDE